LDFSSVACCPSTIRCRAAQVAARLRVSIHTIRRAERDLGSGRTAEQLRGMYARNGIEFIEDGVRRVFKPESRR
jgi:hypothetical protein